MKILITCPNINAQHGGIRVILEWANRLTDLGHKVYVLDQAKRLKCNWFPIKARLVNNSYILNSCDCLIVTSPHGVEYLSYNVPKKFVFIQMMEHYFRPDNKKWMEMCRQFYQNPYPTFAISRWNIDELMFKWGKQAHIWHIGNGVNLDHFPIKKPVKDGKTVLIESPVTKNPSKDPDLLQIKVGQRLMSEGYTVIGYGREPIEYKLSEYHVKPELKVLNDLYSRATILLKATRMDARSCSPMEAMTKGTVTVRGIVMGDDDLNMDNSYRCDYNESDLYSTAKLALNSPLTATKADICRQYVQENNWDAIMSKVNEKLMQ